MAFPASLSPYLQCSTYRSSYCELSSGAPPEARDHGDPTCARRRRGDLPVEQSSVELSRGSPYRLWPGLPLWPTGLVGNALGWSSTDSSEKRRSPPPVSVDTCTGPAGPARRLYKGRHWSFGIHWTGAPWSPRRTLGGGRLIQRPIPTIRRRLEHTATSQEQSHPPSAAASPLPDGLVEASIKLDVGPVRTEVL